MPKADALKRIVSFLVIFAVLSLWLFAKIRSAELKSLQPHQKKVLHLFAMSDYFPDLILRNFENQNDCEIRYDNFSSNEELLAKLQAGATGYDVIVPSDYMIPALVASHLLMKIQHQQLSHFGQIAPAFQHPPYDSTLSFSIPYTWGTTGLLFDQTRIPQGIHSWHDLFDSRFAGHISLLDDEREVLGAMLQMQGSDVNTKDPDALKKAQQALVQLKPNVRLFASDPKQYILSGDIWIAHIFSGDAMQIIKDNPNYHYIVPREGGVIWIDNLAIPRSAQNVELAYAFIDYILDPSVSKIITEKLLYSSPNIATERLVAQENLRPSYLSKVSQTTKLHFLRDLGIETEVWDQLWTEAKSN